MAAGIVAAEATQILEAYEPRIDSDEIMIYVNDILSGQFKIHAEIDTEG
jgi:hypothetical protein